MTLRTHRPSGRPSHPCILIEGEEKAGKSWMAAQFTGDPRVGRALWLDLAEGDGELYGEIPGADYEILEHEGTWASIYGAIRDAHTEAKRAHDAGEKPYVLVVDPIGAMWDLLSDWARNRAKESKSNKKLLAEDENAEINVGPTYWNPATERWRQMMTLLLTFPGIVLLLARGKEVAVIGANGNPVVGKKDYRVEGHKTLCHDVTCWVRLTRGGHPQIVGGRSTKVDLRPENYQPKPLPDFSLPWLVFDVLGYESANARTRDHMEMKPGSDAPMSEHATVIEFAIESASNLDELKVAYERIKPTADEGLLTEAEARRLNAYVRERKAEMDSQPQAVAA